MADQCHTGMLCPIDKNTIMFGSSDVSQIATYQSLGVVSYEKKNMVVSRTG